MLSRFFASLCYALNDIALIIQHRTILTNESALRYFLDALGSYGTIFLHFVVDVLCTADQFEESEVGRNIQVIDVAEYLLNPWDPVSSQSNS